MVRKNHAIGNKVPQVNAKKAMKLYRALNKAIGAGLVASCHDCSDGGLGVALAEAAFAGGLGMNIDLKDVPYRGKNATIMCCFPRRPAALWLRFTRKTKRSLKRGWRETSRVKSALFRMTDACR